MKIHHTNGLRIIGFQIMPKISNHSKCDFHSPYFHSFVVEDKTTCDGTHLYAELPVASAMEDMTYEQVIAIAEAILCHCSREDNERPLTEANKRAFDRLVAEIHYYDHEIKKIKQAIENYY